MEEPQSQAPPEVAEAEVSAAMEEIPIKKPAEEEALIAEEIIAVKEES
jgi:hypothetical protein